MPHMRTSSDLEIEVCHIIADDLRGAVRLLYKARVDAAREESIEPQLFKDALQEHMV